MSTNGINIKTLAAEEGKLMKFIKAVVKLISKEFLLLLLIVIISFPIAYIIEFFLGKTTIKLELVIHKIYPTITAYMAIYIGACLGLYFARLVTGAILTLLKSKTTT